ELERTVGAGESVRAGGEVVAPRPGTGGLVLDGDARVGVLELGDPGVLGGGLAGGATADEGAGESAVAGLGAAGRGLVGGARREHDGSCECDGSDAAGACEFHVLPSGECDAKPVLASARR